MTRACRFCGSALESTFADLGMTPLANAYVRPDQLHLPEAFYPLHAYVCDRCLLVQLEELQSPEAIFSDYLYFSSYSDTWLDHCRGYADAMTHSLGLGSSSSVVEIASNDGYLLQYFKALGIPVLGVEPAANVAAVAVERGIPTVVDFFGSALASTLVRDAGPADLVVANNVVAHVSDLNDFVAGLATLVGDAGVLTIECPHLLQLMAHNQFDTIYHEHFSYFSLLVLCRVLAAHGLQVFDVDELPTHGGSLRIHAARGSDVSPRVGELIAREEQAGLDRVETYRAFAAGVGRTKYELLEFFVNAWREGRSVAGYGAPAKGNTLLNYCGIGPELLPFTVDRSPHKAGLFLPGSRIPILAPEALLREKPDYVLILPWNLRDEIMGQMREVREWGGRFVVPIPEVRVLP